MPNRPRTDPGARNYHTGLFKDTHFRIQAAIGCVLDGHVISGSSARKYSSNAVNPRQLWVWRRLLLQLAERCSGTAYSQ